MAPYTNGIIDFSSLVLLKAPPLDPVWLQHEQDAGLHGPQPVYASPLERQPVYAAKCRAINAAMMAPGARDHYLAEGITTRQFTVSSSADGFPIPVLQYDLLAPLTKPVSEQNAAATVTTTTGQPRTIIVYIHGGGLLVGEADSEDLSCRRILKDAGLANPTLFSIGYRLMPTHPARTCVSDCVDAFAAIRELAGVDRDGSGSTKLLLVGSSSGGQLAALLSQACVTAHQRLDGVVLRCPVTSDAFSGAAYVPAPLRALHTSALEPSFRTVLGGVMTRAIPRDGLPRMPLEAEEAELDGMPRTWVQVCTNDTLYSDGVCYAQALASAGVEVKLDVVRGWPHTFWLKFPELDRAMEADRAMLEGLAWVARG